MLLSLLRYIFQTWSNEWKRMARVNASQCAFPIKTTPLSFTFLHFPSLSFTFLHFPSLSFTFLHFLSLSFLISYAFNMLSLCLFYVVLLSPKVPKAPNLEQPSDVNIWLQLCSEAPNDTATCTNTACGGSISDISDINIHKQE